jgi:Zn-dependent M32 family carboxypeptidase
LDEILNSAKVKLIPLLKQVQSSTLFKTKQILPPLQGGDVWSIDKQAAMCKEVAEAIGFDFDKSVVAL